MVLVLSDDEVRESLDLAGLVDVVGDALANQARGTVERPERPHFPVGRGLDGDEPTGTGIAMPAYVYGAEQYATKPVGVHEANAARDLPTVHAQVVLTDARTGVPEAFLAGTTLTNARTGCVGALAVRELATDAATLGAGAQARWQTRAVDTVTKLSDVRIYSPSDSRLACAADLREADVPARAVGTSAAAVEGADAVVTATTATEPVFPPEPLEAGALVVAVGPSPPRCGSLRPRCWRGPPTSSPTCRTRSPGPATSAGPTSTPGTWSRSATFSLGATSATRRATSSSSTASEPRRWTPPPRPGCTGVR